MEKSIEFLDVIDRITTKDARYKAEAYSFVMAALHYTLKKLKRPRHLTGGELLEGIRKYSLEQFGPLTRTVFDYWGIKNTEDFGCIVFNLVDAKLLSKTEEDSLEDFKNVYDFKEAFDAKVEYKLYND